MKIAIVADWLTTFGGAEHVLAALHELFPNAPLFTTVAAPQNLGPLHGADIRPDTFLQRLYGALGRHEPLLPLMPRAIERIDCRGYDIVLSSSHAVAKGVIAPSGARHICYCHTPMRYAWEMEKEYLRDFRIPRIVHRMIRQELGTLRRWDLSTAKRVDTFIANSTETQARIARTYGRESHVISPPVEDRFFCQSLQNTDRSTAPYLAVGRCVPYKKFDLLIDLANKNNIQLIIAGKGPDLPRLRARAGATVTLRGYVTDEELRRLYSTSRALLFPQIEDAGIVPIEAMACGLPVVAFNRGGVRDVIVDGETGVLATDQTVQAFEEALERFQGIEWKQEGIRNHARRFHIDLFKEKFLMSMKV